jgi:hypothetical protein
MKHVKYERNNYVPRYKQVPFTTTDVKSYPLSAMSPYLEQRNKRLSNNISMNTIQTTLPNDYTLI